MEKRISENSFCKLFFFFKFESFIYLIKSLNLFSRYNKRGPREFKKNRHITNPEIPIDKRGVKDTGYVFDGKFIEIPEKIPELIVPDLTDCKFKPYVTFKSADVVQSEFTSQDLYNAIYAKKVIDDFKNDKLNEDGTSKEPSIDEELTPEEAFNRARKTGSDIF